MAETQGPAAAALFYDASINSGIPAASEAGPNETGAPFPKCSAAIGKNARGSHTVARLCSFLIEHFGSITIMSCQFLFTKDFESGFQSNQETHSKSIKKN